MAHRKWKETKLLPGTAGPGNMLGSSLVSFNFLWAILCPQAVEVGEGNGNKGALTSGGGIVIWKQPLNVLKKVEYGLL